MAVKSILPNTNLTGVDIRDTLNANGGSVGDNFTSFFTSGANINMWSKYKPVISTTLFFDLSLWQSSGFRGDLGDCGLNIKTYSPSTFKTAAKAGTTGWSYKIPSGGSSEPMRLGDFRGYCPSAYNPLGGVASSGLITNGKVTFAVDVAISGTSDTNITLADIKIGGSNGTSLSNYYFGVFVWNSSQSYFYTASSKIGTNANLTIEVPITVAGEYNYIPFLSSVAQTTGSDVSATIVSCNKGAQTLKVVSSGTLRKVIPNGTWNASGTGVVGVSATLVNATSASVTFTGIKIQLRYGSDGASSSLLDTISYSGSVTVAANSSKTIYFDDITENYNQSRTYWLAGYADNTTETTYNQVDEFSPEG